MPKQLYVVDVSVRRIVPVLVMADSESDAIARALLNEGEQGQASYDEPEVVSVSVRGDSL